MCDDCLELYRRIKCLVIITSHFFVPIFGSVPVQIRTMFSLCRQKTKKVKIIPRAMALVGSNKDMKNVEVAAATSAPTEDIRLIPAPTSQARQHAVPTNMLSASIRPRKVATPLPPLNISQIG